MQDTKPSKIIQCPECDANLYYFNVTLDEIKNNSILRSDHFVPLHSIVPQPTCGEILECPFCNSELISVVNTICSIILTENIEMEWDE